MGRLAVLAAMFLLFSVRATLADPITKCFQEGTGGYVGKTHDTELDEWRPDTPLGGADAVQIDYAPGEEQGLLRFEDLFGSEANQIPPNAEILAARLTFEVADDGGDCGTNVHRMIQPWEGATATWNSFVGGVDPNDIEAAVAVDGVWTESVNTGQTFTIDLDPTTLQMWQDGLAPNHGWVLLYQNTALDGWAFSSSENTVRATPRLCVDYEFEPDCNCNGIPDECDLDCGVPGGPCDVPGCGGSGDGNGNGIPDECEYRWRNVTPSQGPSPSPRQQYAMAYDIARGVTVLFGGSTSGDLSNPTGLNSETWEWDGTNWTNVTPAAPQVSPSSRRIAAMTYDAQRHMTVLFGGYDGSVKDDTWEWNGSVWTQRTVDPHPSARYGSRMTYDPSWGTIVLFAGCVGGGGGSGAMLRDVWEWNGTVWAQLPEPPPPPNGPGGREFHRMVYDAVRTEIVVFGGEVGGSQRWGDTWTWDGSLWEEQLITPHPHKRALHGMAYDLARQVAVLFGGYDGPPLERYGDTWEWNGTSWVDVTPIDPQDSPSPREGLAMVYDSARGVIVLFGGDATSGVLSDETWECDTAVAVADCNANGIPDKCEQDSDGDGIIDDCDNCPGTPNPLQADDDLDGVGNVCDNCPAVPNPDQADCDGNDIGDVCDPDIDGDGVPNEDDVCPQTPSCEVLADGRPRLDMNGDCEVNGLDIQIIVQQLLNGCSECD